MKYEIAKTSQFKRDYKRVKAQGKALSKLAAVINCLAEGESLTNEYNDHPLRGNWIGYRECHIEPNWLLIYKIEKQLLILSLTRTGTHAELFNE